MYITALRLLAVEREIKVPVSSLGKWKTTFQMIAIPLLMAYDHPFGISMPLLGMIFISVACIFSVYSAMEYSLRLVKKIRSIRQNKHKSHDQETTP